MLSKVYKGSMKTCCPPDLPEIYEDFIQKDIMDQFDHALVMIRKAKPCSPEFDFYLKIINEYNDYADRVQTD